MIRSVTLLPVLLGVCLVAGALQASEPSSVVGSGWPAYGATAGGTHFSRASQITPANVHLLQVAWHHRSGDFREAREPRKGERFGLTQSSMQVTPILLGERLFYCTPFNRILALDARTGEELWAYDPGVNMDSKPVVPNCRGVSSWQSGGEGLCEQRIIVGTLDARVIALDARSGKPCPDFGVNGQIDLKEGISAHDPAEYSITSPPAILGDTLITGALVLDNMRTDEPAGVVRAYNVRSGAPLWAFNTIQPGAPGRNKDGTWRNGTTNVWSIIAVDEARSLVFLPTGNATPDYFGGHRKGLDYYSSSVVALHGDSGEVAWHFQMVHHDLWDYDTPAQPTLVDLTVNGERVPAVVQVTKMGLTFALHRETGVPLWPVEERPAPQQGKAPEEYLAPTQPFPSHLPSLFDWPLTAGHAWGLTPLDRRWCAQRIEELRNDGLYTPPSLQGSINFPSNAGGNNWGSPALNPDTGLMVVFTNRVPGYTRLIPREQCADSLQPMSGTPYCVDAGWLTSPIGLPCTAPPWGTLDAVDLAAGKRLWSVPLGDTRDMAPIPFLRYRGLPGLGAPMMTATGLVFSGISNEHGLYAFDAATGAELWRGELPTAGNTLPMTYQLEPGGKQYVVIAAGGHWSGGSPPGDHIIAFALPEGYSDSPSPHGRVHGVSRSQAAAITAGLGATGFSYRP